MSRHRAAGSYHHKIQRMGEDWYRLHWTVDRYITGSRLRWPRGYSRDTDEAGAQRFAKRWKVLMATPTNSNSGSGAVSETIRAHQEAV